VNNKYTALVTKLHKLKHLATLPSSDLGQEEGDMLDEFSAPLEQITCTRAIHILFGDLKNMQSFARHVSVDAIITEPPGWIAIAHRIKKS